MTASSFKMENLTPTLLRGVPKKNILVGTGALDIDISYNECQAEERRV